MARGNCLTLANRILAVLGWCTGVEPAKIASTGRRLNRSAHTTISLLNCYCTPGGTRTPNQLLRTQLLYPIELQGQGSGIRESNPSSQLGKLMLNRSTNPASGMADLNCRPHGPKPCALPTELIPGVYTKKFKNFSVPRERLELSRVIYTHKILSLACLPFHHRGK